MHWKKTFWFENWAGIMCTETKLFKPQKWKLNETKLNSLSPKNIKRKICRRGKKIAELKVANKQILIKLNEAFLNEEKLKEEVANSSGENIEYAEEINNLNKLLNESLVWKTKHQKLKWYHNFAMKKKIQWKWHFRD